MEKVSAKDFAWAVRNAGYESDAKFYGTYNGRFMYEGVGVVVTDDHDLIKVIEEIGKNPDLAPIHGRAPDHSDSLGFDRIVAWNKRLFDPETISEADELAID